MNYIRNKRLEFNRQWNKTYVQELWTNRLTRQSHHEINRAKKIACTFTIKM